MKKYLIVLVVFLRIEGAMQKLATPESIVKKTVKQTLQKHQIPGAVIVLYLQGKSYIFPFGYADKEKKTLVSHETIFEIGSITKLFTCLLLAQEVVQGHIKLTDSITQHIPALSANKKLHDMALLSFATHTSTMPFYISDYITSQKAFMSYMLQWQPLQKDSLWWQYSNPGIELIRIALEETLQQNINSLLIERILKPLGMTPMGIYVPQEYQRYCASCYDKAGKKSHEWNDKVLLGSAALRASSMDMLQFLKAAVGVENTPETIKQAMRITQMPYISVDKIKHGLGWQINELNPKPATITNLFEGYSAQTIINPLFNPKVLLDKQGTTNGFHAYIAAMPSKQSGVVVMINRRLPNGLNVVKKMGRDILLQSIT